MPSWDDVRTYLRDRYQLRRFEPTQVELAWTFPDSQEPQRQTIEVRRAMDRPILVVYCDTGQNAFNDREALQHNMTLGVGALAIADGEYVLRHVVSLEELHWTTLDKTLEMLAHEAARLKRHRRGTQDITCLMNYAE